MLNLQQVRVEEVAKGDVPLGQTVRIELPAKGNEHQDVFACEIGTRILIFLRKSGDGRWYPIGGRDAALPVGSKGEVGGYPSSEELLAHLREGKH